MLEPLDASAEPVLQTKSRASALAPEEESASISLHVPDSVASEPEETSTVTSPARTSSTSTSAPDDTSTYSLSVVTPLAIASEPEDASRLESVGMFTYTVVRGPLPEKFQARLFLRPMISVSPFTSRRISERSPSFVSARTEYAPPTSIMVL